LEVQYSWQRIYWTANYQTTRCYHWTKPFRSCSCPNER